MKTTTMALAAFLLGTAAHAGALEDFLTTLNEKGYTVTEVKNNLTTIKAEVIIDGVKQEIVYNKLTGEYSTDDSGDDGEDDSSDGSGDDNGSGGGGSGDSGGSGGGDSGGDGGGSGGGGQSQAFDYLRGGLETDIQFE